MLTLPTHIFVTYETTECITYCSAVVGYIRHVPAVLLIEREDNAHVSITNAIAEVVKAATEPVLDIYRKTAPAADMNVSPPITAEDIMWLEGYEYRIVNRRYQDPGIMRIDVEHEFWVPIEAGILDGLVPFLSVFRAVPRSDTPTSPR